MADHSQTVTNVISLLGQDPPNSWGEYNWGEFDWGSGGPVEDVIMAVTHLISNSQGVNTAIIEQIEHLLGTTITLAEAWSRGVIRDIIVNPVTLAEDISDLLVETGTWDRIFPDGTNNGTLRAGSSWTQPASPSDGWVKSTNPSDGWTKQ